MTTSPSIRPVPEIRPHVTIDPMHLCLTRKWPNGASNNIHLLENGDLGVILSRGDSAAGSRRVPHDDVNGTVVIALGVDGDHDEVHWDIARNNGPDLEELLAEAIESLQACHESVRRIRMADPAGERNAFELGRDHERSLRTD